MFAAGGGWLLPGSARCDAEAPAMTEQLERVVADVVEQVERRFFGKYRGMSSTTRTRRGSAGLR